MAERSDEELWDAFVAGCGGTVGSAHTFQLGRRALYNLGRADASAELEAVKARLRDVAQLLRDNTSGPNSTPLSAEDYAHRLIADRDRLAERVARCEAVLVSIRDNYDCDEDAHRHGTSCRCCDAASALVSAERSEPQRGAP